MDVFEEFLEHSSINGMSLISSTKSFSRLFWILGKSSNKYVIVWLIKRRIQILFLYTCVWRAVKPWWASRFENPKSSEIHTTRKLLKVMIIFSEFVTWCACFGLCQWLWVLYFRMPPSSRKQNHHHKGDDSDTDDDDIKVILFKRCYLNYFKEDKRR